jgi:hypothetical protein
VITLGQCNAITYFAIKSKDEYGNWSAISNVPSATPTCNGASASCVPPPVDVTAPAAVANLSVSSPTGKFNLAVSWTAPGDDGSVGIASEYDLRYSPSPITAGNFSSAIRVSIPAPNAAGSSECGLIAGLSACTNYYIAIKTRDERANWSGISNFPSATTQCSQEILAACSGSGAVKQPIIASDEAPQLFSALGPNPARGPTSFRISVPSPSPLRVGVFDIQGRRVRSLVNRIASPGPAQIEWNMLDDSGRRVASGLYMVRVDVGNVRKTFRLVVVR